jgi:PPP family 3-phenylpropionic acid transporter
MNRVQRGFWTLRYTLINALYFAAFCTIHAMAAVYLLANGFTNTEVGILLAVANITSALCQPIIAGIIDKPGWLTNRRFIIIAVTIILIGSASLMFLKENKVMVFIIYVIIYMIQFAYQPVMTALYFEYKKAGCNIFYGLARGLGSASFAVTSAIMGRLIEKQGVGILQVINIITMALSVLVVFTFKKPEGAAVEETEKKTDTSGEAHNNIIDFAHTYPAFMIFLLATICFYFAHNMINDFMIQIIRNLGGGEKELGYSNFLQAILELPVMALIGIVMKKISSGKMLILSGTAFFIKILILVFATNMAMMYLSQSMQLFAYAVYIPAVAYYVNETMSDSDQVKGQAYVTSAITIGGVFSNLISGVILDHLGIRIMLITGTAVCAVGVFIAVYALGRRATSKATKEKR